MTLLFGYSGALLAAWAAMGGFCLRSNAIRSRYRMSAFSAEDKQRYAFGAGLLCMFSLGLFLCCDQASFAIILWAVVHGIFGAAIAFCMPYLRRVLPASFAVAGWGALLSLLLILIFGA